MKFVPRIIFSGRLKWCKLKDTGSLKGEYDKASQCIKKQRHHIANKCLYKATVFPVFVYGCESWTIKKAEHWRTDTFELWLEKTLQSPVDSKEFKPVNPKENEPWKFTGRTDSETEAPILWPPDEKSQLIGKDPDAGKDWRQEEKGMTEDKMVGWHHWLNGHAFE